MSTAPTVAVLRQDRARYARIWIGLRLIGPAIIGLQVFALFRTHPEPGPHGTGLAVLLGAIALAVGGVGALVSRDGAGRAPLPFVLLLLGGSVVLGRFQPAGPGIIGLFVAVALASRRLSSRAGTVLAGIVLVAMTVTLTLEHERSPVTGLVTGIAMASFYTVTRLARQLSTSNKQAEELVLELQESRQEQARAAAMAERHRVAREMHDVLAHSLSGLLLQLEGARILSRDVAGHEKLCAVIERAHHLAKAGAEEARDAIHTLRDEAFPGLDDISRLVEQFRADTGIRCTFAVAGNIATTGAAARLTLYRVIQESLTNIAKHADPDRVDIALACRPEQAVLTVEDVGRDRPAGGDGYGLAGMRERAELLGGTLRAGPTGAGFRVELELPPCAS